MLLKIMERWGFLQVLPEQGNLVTMRSITDLRMKLGTSSEEQAELEMTIGVVCNECENPVEDRAKEGEKPHYYCIICDKFVDDTKGLPERTIWNSDKDVEKKIEFNRAERRIVVKAFNSLDKKEEVTAVQALLWEKFRETYPEKNDKDDKD